jgi:hypothetical protein
VRKRSRPFRAITAMVISQPGRFSRGLFVRGPMMLFLDIIKGTNSKVSPFVTMY